MAFIVFITFTSAAAPLAAQVPVSSLVKCKQDRFENFEVGVLTFGGTNTQGEEALEDALLNAHDFYGKHFRNPWLVCFDDPSTGSRSYAIIWHPNLLSSQGDLGEYIVPDAQGAGADRAQIHLDEPSVRPAYDQYAAAGIGKASDAFAAPYHELFHAIQANYETFQRPKGGSGYALIAPDWAWEGMADALAWTWVMTKHRGLETDRTKRGFDLPLNKPADKSSAYGTDLFWEFLMREPRYDNNTVNLELSGKMHPGLIQNFLNLSEDFPKIYAKYSPFKCLQTRPDGTCAKSNQEDWAVKALDEMLKEVFNAKLNPSPPLEGGLYVVYPKFAAWLLDTVADKNVSTAAQGIGKHWSSIRAVQLPPSSEFTGTVSVKRLASECILVRMPSGTAGRDFFFTVLGDRDTLESLHLGVDGTDWPVTTASRDNFKSWVVPVKSSESHKFLVLSNVFPIAEKTIDRTVQIKAVLR